MMTKERLEELEKNITTFDSVQLYNTVKELTAEILKMETIPEEYREKLMNLIEYATDKLNGDDSNGTANSRTNNRPC